jgi:hypothetical protein
MSDHIYILSGPHIMRPALSLTAYWFIILMIESVHPDARAGIILSSIPVHGIEVGQDMGLYLRLRAELRR